MAKEITLYYGIYNWTAEALINKIEEHMGEELTMRVCSPGGDVFAAWGVCAKISEHGNITMKLDGMSASAAGLMLPLYAKRVESLDVTRGLLHRANAYVSTPEEQKLLNDINADIRKKIEMRVTAEKFKKVTGATLDDLFNPETRIDIWLSAKQMKELGIVHKVNTLKPAEMEATASAIVAASIYEADVTEKPTPQPTQKPPTPTPTQTQKTKNMTLEELKTQNPTLYAQIVAEAKKEGAKEERDRIGAWLAWVQIDAKKVVEGIKSGDVISQTIVSEFQVAALSTDRLEKLKRDSAGKVPTGADTSAGADAAKPEVSAFEAAVDGLLGKKPSAVAAV